METNKNNSLFFGRRSAVIIPISAVLGILLLIMAPISIGMGQNDEPQETELEKYIKETEDRLCNAISRISGAGNTKVFISVENTFETIYASNASIDESADEKRTNKTTKKELALTNEGGTEGPVVIKQLCPKICGVLIVCEGGAEPAIRQEIINSVSIAVGISAGKIYVTGGTEQ